MKPERMDLRHGMKIGIDQLISYSLVLKPDLVTSNLGLKPNLFIPLTFIDDESGGMKWTCCHCSAQKQ